MFIAKNLTKRHIKILLGSRRVYGLHFLDLGKHNFKLSVQQILHSVKAFSKVELTLDQLSEESKTNRTWFSEAFDG